MPVRGNLNGLKDLASRIQMLTTAGFKAELAQVLGAAAVKQVADSFRHERDPYGRAWEPLKSRKGKILRDTGRMASAVAVEPRPNGFKLSIATVYAPIHQHGAKIRAHRRGAGSVLKNRRGRFVSKESAAKSSESAHNRWAKAMEAYEDGARKTRPAYPKAAVQTHGRAAYQHGGSTIPQRQMVPDQEGGGLGPIWTEAFKKEAESLIRRRLKVAA